MATLTIKLLADGQLPSSEGDLYVVPADTKALIKTIKLVNTDASARVINIYVKKASGTSRRIAPKNMGLNASYMAVIDDELTLGVGDAIRGECDSATIIDYTIYGVEETA